MHLATKSDGWNSRLRSVWRCLIPLGVLVAALACVYVVVEHQRIDTGRVDRQRFARLTDHVHADLLRRLNRHYVLLESVRATFIASSYVSDDEFATLSDSLNVAVEFPAAAGIGYLRNSRQAGGGAGQRTDRQPIFEYYRPVASHISNDDSFSGKGDPLSRELRGDNAEAVLAAALPDSSTIAGPLALDGEPHLVWLDPIVKPGDPASLLGWVYAPISLAGIVEALAARHRNELHFRLVDCDTQETLWTASESDLSEVASSSLFETRRLRIGDRTWWLTSWESPHFEHTPSNAIETIVLGSSLSVALTLLVSSLSSARRSAERLADAKTAALAESERLLREEATRSELALEGGGLGRWDWDIPTGRVVVDSRTSEIVGELLGTGVRDLDWFQQTVHPDDVPMVFDKIERHFQDPDWHYTVDFRLRSTRGGYRWVRSCGRVVQRDEAGEPVRMSGTHADVTEAIEAAAASEEKERRAQSLAQIITESPNELYILRRDTLRFVEVNDGARAATGYTRNELLAITAVDLKPEFDEAKFRSRIGPLARGEVSVMDLQTIHRRNNGSTYPVQVSLHTAVYDNTPVYVAFVTDLTELRRLESRLAEARRLESLGQLAAGIAHEINTPMQCVAGNIDYVTECQDRVFQLVDELLGTFELPQKSWQERQDAVAQIIESSRYDKLKQHAPAALTDIAEASRRVVETVRAMKSMSHPGATAKGATDINDLIRNAATVTKNRWKYTASLELELDESAPAAPALAAELSQVLINLIVNASDALLDKNGEGGPLGQITIRTRSEPGAVVVEIEDDGTGIPDTIRGQIYDPFFTTKEVGRGTGQGLAITYDIVVNKHGGTIDLLTTEGAGTTFVLHLPTEAPIADEAQPADQAAIAEPA
ncbi:MAG: ATP-binding protein [Planctomycetota bacterium]